MEAWHFPCSLGRAGQLLFKDLSGHAIPFLIHWQEKASFRGDGIFCLNELAFLGVGSSPLSSGYKRDKKKTEGTQHHAVP